MPITTLQLKNAKPGIHADGNGLYLQVKGQGTKSWIFRYQVNGRRREMGLGSASVLPIAVARAEAARLRAMVANKVDPLEVKKSAAIQQQEAQAAVAREAVLEGKTFRVAATTYIAAQEAGWRNLKHRQQWENTLKTYAYPVIGDLAVRDIEVGHVLAVLQPIWSTKPETASRVRMRIEAVLNSAKLMGWRSGENPAVWRGGLEAVLPRTSKVRRVRHHPAMAAAEIGAFMAKLREREGLSACALEFTILTAARSGEVRQARWDEVDRERELWIIPAEKMKAGREHRVPLSEAALALLDKVPAVDDCPLIFPGFRNRPLSDMSLSAVLKRMGLADVTVHGFRSTFRDWAAEHTHHHPEVVEMALAHAVGNKVEAAYRRGDMLAKRQALMEDWANWCSVSLDQPDHNRTL
ncbi:site-specific integrase [Parafrankia sp. BMG5.11]|uniref:tyrosine-type recombinase/integrase n=1 Tax=Parafrankia sp. BMG5.11 TaxID=222540 RepID=UPI001A9FED3C|nr:site-specific integrase [Parafrankia sp. BMG5.11]